ncbi:GNAT family N-acetyltransferase [Heyndrickxia acidiproducens]|uniref:GNAT family N-acetyltransferase n=1 Tax=Heyndrickxia acidiproducens TaxID=1121084 RepID=UPI00036B424B|nr:GNAT family N-acetyltransferase [Heyndrickxia acidiproducens]
MFLEKFEIRPLHTIEEMEEARKLESKVWGSAESIPVHQTITAVKNGGLMVGAYHQDRLIGFQYSFPGFDGEKAYLCSHILATDPAYRNKGVGEKLKLAQRDEALKLGYSLIQWTYDPLESINGYLNIGKLGGICSVYIPNCYGEMDDFLNKGIPSDRFLVQWHILGEQKTGKFSEVFNEETVLRSSLWKWETNKQGLPLLTETITADIENKNVWFVPIPKHYRQIRETNMALATDWRMKTRDTFTRLFSLGYKASSFKKIINKEIPVNFYMLARK